MKQNGDSFIPGKAHIHTATPGQTAKIKAQVCYTETKRIEHERNETKSNEIDRNETKRNETTSHFVSFRFDRFRFVLFTFVSFRFVSISFRTLQVPSFDSGFSKNDILELIVFN